MNVDDYVEQGNENVAISIGNAASGAQFMIRKSSSFKLSVFARYDESSKKSVSYNWLLFVEV